MQIMQTKLCDSFFGQKTKGGVLLPEKGVGSVLEGTVVAVGPGARDKVRIDACYDKHIRLC